jgi:N12 class adenine-specific DNA methylase
MISSEKREKKESKRVSQRRSGKAKCKLRKKLRALSSLKGTKTCIRQNIDKIVV